MNFRFLLEKIRREVIKKQYYIKYNVLDPKYKRKRR